MTVEIRPVSGMPEVGRGDDLAALIAAHTDLHDGDVVVVAQKVVSKAEGRVVPPPAGGPPAEARRRVARAEARRIVADTPRLLVTETPHGFVCANGGVDATNEPGGLLVLLPQAPDASARRLRADLRARTGRRLGVVVTDTFGRPWRLGQTDVAIGVAGVAPLRDERGGTDRHGHLLEVTEAAVADAIAGAADLVRRKADGVPVVVLRGLDLVLDDDGPGAAALVRPAAEDAFRRGAGSLAVDLCRACAVPDQPVPAWLLARALDAVRALAPEVAATALDGPPTRVMLASSDPLEAGVAAGVLVAALTDGGAVAARRPRGTGEAGDVVVEAGWPP